MFTWRPRTTLCTTVVISCLTLAYAACADASGGLRAGFSSNPDQVLLGGQLELAPVAHNLYIIPSGDLGLGDDATTLSFNGDLQYRFVSRSSVRFYAGGGLSLFYVNVNNGGGSDTNLGLSALGGMFFNRNSKNPMFVEVKAGLTDEVPDWRTVFGVNF